MEASVLLLPGKEKYAADCLYRPAFAADEASKIVGCDPHGEFDGLAAIAGFGHFDQVGRTDQRFDDLFDSTLHISHQVQKPEKLILRSSQVLLLQPELQQLLLPVQLQQRRRLP